MTDYTLIGIWELGAMRINGYPVKCRLSSAKVGDVWSLFKSFSNQPPHQIENLSLGSQTIDIGASDSQYLGQVTCSMYSCHRLEHGRPLSQASELLGFMAFQSP